MSKTSKISTKPFKGGIERVFKATCGRCVHSEYTSSTCVQDAKTKADAVKVFSDLEWRHDPKFGLVCPECVCELGKDEGSEESDEEKAAANDWDLRFGQ